MAKAGLTDLILIKLWVLRLWLEGDYNEANKDVDNEEGDDNDVEEVEKCNVCPMVFFWSQVNLSWVYGGIEKPGQRKVLEKTTSFKEDIEERNATQATPQMWKWQRVWAWPQQRCQSWSCYSARCCSQWLSSCHPAKTILGTTAWTAKKWKISWKGDNGKELCKII